MEESYNTITNSIFENGGSRTKALGGAISTSLTLEVRMDNVTF